MTVTTETSLVMSPASLIQALIDRGKELDVEKLAVLMELQFKWDREQARKAWIAALQAFKANPPKLEKTHLVSFPNRDGGKTEYHHAELDVVNGIVQPALRQHGLTATWKTSDNQGRITVTCVLQHADGHIEEIATLSGPADTSGGKNNVQAIGSTTTYLSRYTLFAGLGLVAHGADDDGKSGEGMEENAIDDYCIQMKDMTTLAELQAVFKECYQKAKALDDKGAKDRLTKVYEARKRELL
jgi:hypothetical protein